MSALSPYRIGFVGFRHSHVLSLYRAASKDPRVQIAGLCESDPLAAADIVRGEGISFTHSDPDALIADPSISIVAIGDYYGARGGLVLAALQAGKHVIADKPVCTSLDELKRITDVLRQRPSLQLGCLLDLRTSPALATARRLILAGEIGEVHTVSFSAQHPLRRNSRPGWYFEPGKHGGTLNDIAIHALDLVPWLTGRSCKTIHSARAWNARLPEVPYFQDAGQLLIELDNQGGLFGDVSYLAPDQSGFVVPQYWRFLIHGANGMIETSTNSPSLLVATHTDNPPRTVEADPGPFPTPLDDFLDQIEGRGSQAGLNTQRVLQASAQALTLQAAADQGYHGTPITPGWIYGT